MANIRLDILALSANKRDIERRISELESLNSSLDALLTDIESSWDGAASEAYIARMREHKTKAVQMVKVLSEFNRYIDEAITKFENIDKKNASQIRGC